MFICKNAHILVKWATMCKKITIKLLISRCGSASKSVQVCQIFPVLLAVCRHKRLLVYSTAAFCVLAGFYFRWHRYAVYVGSSMVQPSKSICGNLTFANMRKGAFVQLCRAKKSHD